MRNAESILKTSTIAMILTLLASSAPGPGGSEPEPSEYDTIDTEPRVSFSYEIVGAKFADVKRRWSNRVDDVDCDHIYLMFSVGGRSSTSATLSQRGFPERALYEWHLCFEVDGRVYRGWRGFDPGPGSLVELECRVDVSEPPSDEYACVTKDLKLNPDNYGEAAYACSDTEPCRGFESRDEYLAWKALPVFTFQEAILAASALIRHEVHSDSYIAANPMNCYVTVDDQDLPRSVGEALSTDAIRFFPASDKPEEAGFAGGMTMRIGGFVRRSDGTMEVSYSFYCGPLCGSGNTAIMRKDETGAWKVLSTEMNWIS